MGKEIIIFKNISWHQFFAIPAVVIEAFNILNNQFYVGDEFWLRYDEKIIKLMKDFLSVSSTKDYYEIVEISEKAFEYNAFHVYLDKYGDEHIHIDDDKINLYERYNQTQNNMTKICNCVNDILNDESKNNDDKIDSMKMLFCSYETEIDEVVDNIATNAEYLPDYSEHYTICKRNFETSH